MARCGTLTDAHINYIREGCLATERVAGPQTVSSYPVQAQ